MSLNSIHRAISILITHSISKIVSMFQTSQAMELDTPFPISSEDYKQWHCVSQVIPVPWFHIRYKKEGAFLEQILMTGDLDLLEEINDDPSIKLVDVSLASPPLLNGTQGWLLSALKSVTALIISNGNSSGLLGHEYLLLNGEIMVDSFGKIEEFDQADIDRHEVVLVKQ